MRIGVVSDTHNHLPNVRQIVALFNAAGVARVVHTGDITQAKTIDALAGLEAPVTGVFGNNDVERDALGAAIRRHGFAFHDDPLALHWAERRIVVVHDPRELTPERLAGASLALHGHTHLHVCETRAGTLVLNPGESAGHMSGHNRVAVVDLPSLDVEILRF